MPNAELQVQKTGLAGSGWTTEGEAPPSFRSPWDDYRRRRRFFLAAFLSPFVFALGYPLWLLVGNVPVFYVFVAWLPLYAVGVMWLHRFPCPRCSRPFFCKRLDRNTFTGHCLHCGLPKWSLGEAEPIRQTEAS
jgi:hypothetical protein